MEKLKIPKGLSNRGRQAAKIIIDFAKRRKGFSTGGCTPFYTPTEWKESGERYGHESCLIVCHDGGDFSPIFNLDYMQYDLYDKMVEALGKAGFYPEGMYCWCTAIYDEEVAK